MNQKKEISYDKSGLPRQIFLPGGSSIMLEYDRKGNLTSFSDPDGVVTAYTYDNLNRLVATTDGKGNNTKYMFDNRDQLIGIVNPDGSAKNYFYDKSGNIVKVKDFNGAEISIDYNVMNQVEKITDSQGREIVNRYDQMGNISEKILMSGAVISYLYDKHNRLKRKEIRKAQGEEPTAVFTFYYDPSGNLLATLAGDGKNTISETRYEYDALNRVTAVVSPVGGRTAYTYHGSNKQVASIADPLNNLRSYSYDEAGKLTARTDIHGSTTRYKYNALGKPEEIIDGAGRTTKYIYSPGGRVTKMIFPDGQELSYEYNCLGQVSAVIDKKGMRITYFYDNMGRIIKATDSNGREKAANYDVTGNITSVIDVDGSTSNYEYNLSGKLSALTDSMGNRTEYGYDANDRLIHVCQKGKNGENSRDIYYQWNALGWLETIRDAMGRKEFFSYDAMGKIVKKIDKEGFQTCFDYAADGKIININYADGNKTELEYTPLRQISCIKNRLGEINIERDVTGRVVKVVDHTGQAVNYEWGINGEQRSITYPDGKRIVYQYDNLLRMEKMLIQRFGEEDIETTYHYGSNGKLRTKISPAGLKTTWNYDDMGHLLELIHEDGEKIYDHFTYDYDRNGNKILIRNKRLGLPEEEEFKYNYDIQNRLTGVEQNGKLLRKFHYDSFGNRLFMEDYAKDIRHDYTYDILNQLLTEETKAINDRDLTKENTFSYIYDQRGNLIHESQNGELTCSYSYDATNRLESVSDGKRKVAYRYNGLGQRAGKDDEEYLLDLTRPYHNLLEIRSNERLQSFYWDSDIAVVEEQNKGNTGFFLTDEMGSPIRLLYANGEGTAYAYDEFGNSLNVNQEEQNSEKSVTFTEPGKTQPFGFTGYRLDEVSGNYFAQAREYVPRLGRFTAEDRKRGNKALPFTLNRYGYCWNNPLKWVDLDGMSPTAAEDINILEELLLWLFEEEAETFFNYEPEESHFSKYEQYMDELAETTKDNILEVDSDWEAIKGYIDKDYIDNVVDAEAGTGVGIGGSVYIGSVAAKAGFKPIYGVVNEHGELDFKSGVNVSGDILGLTIGIELVFNWSDVKFENVLGIEKLQVGESAKLEFGGSFYYIYGVEAKASIDLVELLKPFIQHFKNKECNSSN